MLSTFAHLERDFIGQRTAETLAIKKEQGVKVGVRLNDQADPEVIKRIRALREDGMSWPKIAQTLNDDNVPTFQGKGIWHPMTCKRIAER
jgi:DNA invertase Pin-like site-specific DNA recombinase